MRIGCDSDMSIRHWLITSIMGGYLFGKYPKKGKKDEKSEDKKEKKCFTCGSSTHLNKDCRKRKGACFNCGEMGHFTRDCPKRRGQGGQVNNLEASG